MHIYVCCICLKSFRYKMQHLIRKKCQKRKFGENVTIFSTSPLTYLTTYLKSSPAPKNFFFQSTHLMLSFDVLHIIIHTFWILGKMGVKIRSVVELACFLPYFVDTIRTRFWMIDTPWIQLVLSCQIRLFQKQIKNQENIHVFALNHCWMWKIMSKPIQSEDIRYCW